MKKITLSIVALASGLIFNPESTKAQNYLNQVIVANGGVFESAAPYNDRATIASYNPTTNTYVVFDTIQVESVQDVVIDTNYAYLAAQDSIVKYNLTTLQREAIAYFPNIKKLEVQGNYLLVGKYYGSGDYFAVYNKTNLQPIFSSSQITETVNGMAILGDSIYVAHNLKGTIDLYPPFGVYADSIGKLAVFHLPSQTFARHITLGENAAGAGKTFVHNNAVYTICKKTGYLFKYTPTTNQIDSFNIGVNNFLQFHNGILYADFPTGIGAYNLNTNTMLPSPAFVFGFVAGTYDYISSNFYFTNTDYASFGKLSKVNNNGNVIDTVNVGISCEAIALQYLSNTSNTELAKAELKSNVFPNPFTNFVNVTLPENSEVYAYDYSGKLVYSSNSVSNHHLISTENWGSGMYILKIVSDNNVQTFKILKQ
jgi:hypothetical protein